MSEVIGIRTRMWIPNSSWQRSAIYEYTCHYYYHFIIIIFNPGRKSRDFKNCKKSVKLEWLLIRVIINRKKPVVQQHRIKALHHHRQTLEQERTLTVIAR